MTMENLDSTLRDAARRSAADYFSLVVDSTQGVESRLIDETRLRGRIQSNELGEVTSLLSASLLLNDLSVVNCLGGGPTTVRHFSPKEIHKFLGSDDLIFHVDPRTLESADVDSAKPYLLPCFMYPTSGEIDGFLREASDLIADGRVIFQPNRCVIGRQRSSLPTQNHWAAFEVDSRSPFSRWNYAANVKASAPTKVMFDTANSRGTELFDVVLPIASGVPLRELNKLLNDEKDLVASFRESLKEAIRSSKNDGASTLEFVKDVVEPQLGSIQRRYKALKRTHTAKSSLTAVTSLALSYTMMDMTSTAAVLLGLAAGGGFHAVGTQIIDYRADLDQLKEERFYLLWRCKQIAGK